MYSFSSRTKRKKTYLVIAVVSLSLFLLAGTNALALVDIPAYFYVGVNNNGGLRALSSVDDLRQNETLQMLATKEHIDWLDGRVTSLDADYQNYNDTELRNQISTLADMCADYESYDDTELVNRISFRDSP